MTSNNLRKDSSKTKFHPRPDVIEKKLLQFVKETEDTYKLSLRLKSSTISSTDLSNVHSQTQSGAGDSKAWKAKFDESRKISEDSGQDPVSSRLSGSKCSIWVDKKAMVPTREKFDFTRMHDSVPADRQTPTLNLPESIYGDYEETDDPIEKEIMARYMKSRLEVPDLDYSGYSSDPRFLDLIDALTPCYKTTVRSKEMKKATK